MPEDVEDIKNEINAFCNAKADQKSCVQGTLKGITLAKKLIRENKSPLLEKSEELIILRLT